MSMLQTCRRETRFQPRGFEAIHPFTDGNGRTGRILNLLLLVEQELLAQPVLYLSRAIIRRRTDYYSGHMGDS